MKTFTGYFNCCTVLLIKVAYIFDIYHGQCVEVNLVAETDNFVWKSHSKLDRRTEPVKFDPGMQVRGLEGYTHLWVGQGMGIMGGRNWRTPVIIVHISSRK